MALSVREPRGSSSGTFPLTSLPRASIRRAGGSTRCSRSRRGSVTRSDRTRGRRAPYRASSSTISCSRPTAARCRRAAATRSIRGACSRRHGADAVRMFLIALEPGVAATPLRRDGDSRDRRPLSRHVQERVQRDLRDVRELRMGAVATPIPTRPSGRVDRSLDPVATRERRERACDALLDRYEATHAVNAVMEFFVDDVSNWYVRVNRHRFYDVDTRRQSRSVRDAARSARRRLQAARAVRAVRHRLDASRADGRLGARRAVRARTPSRIDAALESRNERRPDARRRSAAPRAKKRASRCASRSRACCASRRPARTRRLLRRAVAAAGRGAQREAGRVRRRSADDFVTLEAKTEFPHSGEEVRKGDPAAAAAVAALRRRTLLAFERGEKLSVVGGYSDARPRPRGRDDRSGAPRAIWS